MTAARPPGAVASEGIVGVVGLAPVATADFYAKLVACTPATKDWHHLRVLIDSNPKIPSRGRHLELGEADPSPSIRETIAQLAAAGATVIAVPCNTAHVLYDRYASGAPADTPNLPELTARALAARMRAPGEVVVFASRLTAAHALYEAAFAPHGRTVRDGSRLQDEVSALIEQVKQSFDLPAARARFARILRETTGAAGIVLGCTELSVIADPADAGAPLVDSNLALAEYCRDHCRGLVGSGVRLRA